MSPPSEGLRRKLVESEKRYKSALDHMREGFQIISPDYTYIYVNDAAAAHGKSTKQELIGRKMTEEYPGIDQTIMFSSLRKCIEEKVPARIENEFFYPDGTSSWFYLSIEPVPDGALILSTDITDQKKAASEIIRLNRVYAVLSNINQAIVRIRNREILFETAASVAIADGEFKFTWIGLIDTNNTFVKKTAAFRDDQNTISRRVNSSGEYTFWTKEGKETIFEGNYYIYNDLESIPGEHNPFKVLLEGGCRSGILFPLVVFDKVEGLISLFSGEKDFFEGKEIALLSEMIQDISFALETIDVNKHLIEAKEKAEEMNLLKSNFLANMSHELRTPMIGILGTADIIRDADSLEEVMELLPTFEESSQRLLRTLNHILDLSKIEAEKFDSKFRRC